MDTCIPGRTRVIGTRACACVSCRGPCRACHPSHMQYAKVLILEHMPRDKMLSVLACPGSLTGACVKPQAMPPVMCRVCSPCLPVHSSDPRPSRSPGSCRTNSHMKPPTRRAPAPPPSLLNKAPLPPASTAVPAAAPPVKAAAAATTAVAVPQAQSADCNAGQQDAASSSGRDTDMAQKGRDSIVAAQGAEGKAVMGPPPAKPRCANIAYESIGCSANVRHLTQDVQQRIHTSRLGTLEGPSICGPCKLGRSCTAQQ